MSTFQKIINTGLGAALMTESGLRKLLVETKDSISELLLSEIKKFLARIDLQSELRRALSGMEVEVNATIKLIPREGSHQKTTVHKFRYLPKAKSGK